MDLAYARWTTADDFLSDLPTRHCTVKPRHTFCTICYRINHDVAFDCPLREAQEVRAPEPARPRAPALPYAVAHAPPFQTGGPWPPPPPPEMPEGPVIEFSRTGEAPPKRRVKAKAVASRGPEAPAPPPTAPAPAIADAEEERLMAELKAWEPQSSAASRDPTTEPAAAPPPPTDPSEENRPHRTPRPPKQ